MPTEPIEVVLDFVDAIHRRDLARMEELMTENHVLTDSLGTAVEGRVAVLEAWKTYFQWMPDYRIDVRQSVSEGKAVVRRGEIESFRVYADNKAVYEILAR